ncbi:methylated-DNA--[protein]-cysteine S-methyltransferase [Piscinibacter koreensis]|uniref:Methylated-DNA--protein-cysteine methyltransferase n=1 Tax=Piscinibacter koreensis TaxID=2742824 RepID=A0A7Y6TVN9_9BURK|nr:methylated-DNA--[protein]-cysteine S-methyltransferase [Schlegelella koreensis]NUZ05121.1 methylated-DNA--[protein]-cysteine S-methyltransferase [Schlegelella koreensis]
MSFAIDFVRGGCSAQARHASPLGSILLARTPRGLAGAWFEGQKHHPPTFDAPTNPDDPLLRTAIQQLAEYFAGSRSRFDVALDAAGTPFQRAVWAVLADVEPGRTCSYAEVARRVGRPSAVRAVAAAIGRNPLSIIVPCHRVVGSDGALTGYAGGIDRKTALLALERQRFGEDGGRAS